MYSLVFYSHSDYSDAWAPMFGQTDKYFDDSYKKYLFVNKGEYDIPSGWIAIEYDDDLPYQQRVVSCLEKLDKEERVVFHHEDMFLLNSPDFDKMTEIEQMINSEKAHFIKLCKATYRPQEFYLERGSDIFQCPRDLAFAIQPTMCKVKDLLTIYQHTPGSNIWEFESNSNFICAQNNMVCCFVNQEGEKRIGMFHWESFTYPYVATAIVKGEWNTEGYAAELATIFEKYSIDPSIRGVNA
tara:strand:+ start:3209 stop:3931 length:723 start_codon:yes stop_codon:yes gene_type:complete